MDWRLKKNTGPTKQVKEQHYFLHEENNSYLFHKAGITKSEFRKKGLKYLIPWKVIGSNPMKGVWAIILLLLLFLILIHGYKPTLTDIDLMHWHHPAAILEEKRWRNNWNAQICTRGAQYQPMYNSLWPIGEGALLEWRHVQRSIGNEHGLEEEQACMLRFWKGKGTKAFFSSVKGTLWENC